MIFSLDVRRARKGDCLLLHYGSQAEPRLVMIDGGPADVYKPQLKPRIAEIRKQRGLAAADSLPVDLLMVSHIDDDHINGILELTAELVTAANEKRPLPLRVRSFWHNSFDDIIGNNPKELTSAVAAQFGASALTGEPDTDAIEPEAAMVLASVDQGFRLRDDAKRLKLRLNPEFGGKLAMAKSKGKSLDFGSGLKLTVAGPMKPELEKLQKEHDDWLKKHKKDKTKSVPAAFTDTSVPNLSSIVVLAEAKKKRILLTGDARGDKVLEGLELVGLLKTGGTLKVDVLKMPHHGSDRNMEPIFLRRIIADHYVFSGNGEHGNPERATLQMLFDERGDKPFTMHFTYPIAEIDAGRKLDWEKEQAKEKARKKKTGKGAVREDWSPEKHSLTAFFEGRNLAAAGQKIAIVEDQKPHVIDLADPLGF